MRNSGILLHISSLPSPYGIGSLGREAFAFVDFLARAGQRYWQTLPIGPTGYGDSPYQSYSTFAGNPYFIDLDLLAEEGLLEPAALRAVEWGEDPARVDYGSLWENRFRVLRQAFSRAIDRDRQAVDAFCARESGWLEDYALYMSVKSEQNHLPLEEWPEKLRRRDAAALLAAGERLKEDVSFWKWIQFRFWGQWNRLRSYAAQKNVLLIGDLPFYVARDSADVWVHPRIFQLDSQGLPKAAAGCPPDCFNADGQLWGNPLYDWDCLRGQGYGWWIDRIKGAFRAFDLVRIDHFRGFESYYSIPAGHNDAKRGRWMPGPGMDFFRALKRECPDPPIIAEDLGAAIGNTRRLLQETGFPGMKVLQFAFDPEEDSEFLPHHHHSNCVAYIGTHDNDTLMGWLESARPEVRDFARRYMGLPNGAAQEVEGWIRTLFMSCADRAILTMQDLIHQPAGARMNTPSTALGNWRWRLRPGEVNPWLADRLLEMTTLYRRRAPKPGPETANAEPEPPVPLPAK